MKIKLVSTVVLNVKWFTFVVLYILKFNIVGLYINCKWFNIVVLYTSNNSKYCRVIYVKLIDIAGLSW